MQAILVSLAPDSTDLDEDMNAGYQHFLGLRHTGRSGNSLDPCGFPWLFMISSQVLCTCSTTTL